MAVSFFTGGIQTDKLYYIKLYGVCRARIKLTTIELIVALTA